MRNIKPSVDVHIALYQLGVKKECSATRSATVKKKVHGFSVLRGLNTTGVSRGGRRVRAGGPGR